MFDFTAIETALSADPSIEALRGNRPLISFMKEGIKTKMALTRWAASEWRKYYNSCRKIRRENKVALAEGKPEQTLPPYPNAWGVDKGSMRALFLAYAWLRFRSLSTAEPKAKTDPGARSIIQAIKEWSRDYEAAKAKETKANVA